MAVVASFTLATALLPSMAGASDLCTPPQIERIPNWTYIRPPATPEDEIPPNDPFHLASLARQQKPQAIFDPVDAGTIFYSTGNSILRTTDGGCNWEIVFRSTLIPQQPAWTAVHANRIESIGIGRSQDTHKTILVGIPHGYTLSLQYFGFDVFVSHDSGTTWVTSSTVFPTGTPREFAVAPGTAGKVVYLTTTDDILYRSDDGGVAWSQVTPADTSEKDLPATTSVSVNPADPDELAGLRFLSFDGEAYWTVGRSKDGGESWSVVGDKALPVSSFDVLWSRPGTSKWVVALAVPDVRSSRDMHSARKVYRSDDDAHSWTRLPLLPDFPGGTRFQKWARSIRFVGGGNTLVTSLAPPPGAAPPTGADPGDPNWKNSGIYRLKRSRTWTNITPRPANSCSSGTSFVDRDCNLFNDVVPFIAPYVGFYTSRNYTIFGDPEWGGQNSYSTAMWRYGGPLQ